MTSEQPRILVVDDDPLIRTSLFEVLRQEGHRVDMASSAQEALTYFERESFPIVISDLKMPGMDGIQLLQELRRRSPEVAVVLITGFGTIETAVDAMRQGAYDFVTKPLADGEIQLVIQKICRERELVRENEVLRQQLSESLPSRFHDLVGPHPRMHKIYAMIEAVASTKATVFIRGESGTGKGLIARAIHACDANRKDQPFVEISCGALPETMLESELFGHVRGSFTGAIRDRTGRFELAHGGTIFLDEIDTLTPALQVKLLRVLQSGEFERVGDTKTFCTDARIIAAMNRDPEAAIRAGTFREDLYYRLNVFTIQVPQLKDRMEDIPLLADHFLAKSAARLGRPAPQMTDSVLKVLMAYDWPGNVRELENAIERAIVLSNGQPIAIGTLPEAVLHARFPDTASAEAESLSFDGASNLKQSLETPERQIIEEALARCGWNCQRAATSLGVNRATLYNKMKRYGIPTKSRQKVIGS